MSKHGESALEARGLEVRYKSAVVLQGLTLRINPGEIYALLGGNGAGKSTTLNAFLGFVRPTGGSVTVCGLDVSSNPIAVRAQLAYVPENVALYEDLTARENITYFSGLAGGKTLGAGDVEAALGAVKLDRSAWDRRLSGSPRACGRKLPSRWPSPARFPCCCSTSRRQAWTRRRPTSSTGF